MPAMFDLSGRAALITGGNGGIGLAMARGMAEAGASIAIAGRNRPKSEQAAKGLEKDFGVRAVTIDADVADEAQVRSMVEQAQRELGRLDILVNNAGTNIRKPAHDLTMAEWHRVLDTNLTSVFVASQAAYAAFKRAGGGKIINIGSMFSVLSAGFAPVYSATKGGLVQLTKSMAIAWAKDNIQVNAVLPGWIDTELTQRARSDVPGLHDSVLSRSPTGRWGRPEDLAGVAVFLASSASDFVTAASIPVDGGYLAVG
jgi:2-deoxy-D-gluconate 3-dehydrogenase